MEYCNKCKSKHILVVSRGLMTWIKCNSCNHGGIITADNMKPYYVRAGHYEQSANEEQDNG